MSVPRPAVELVRLEAASARPEFTCGDADIDEFFHKDSIDGTNELLSVTYVWREGGQALAFFAVSNDSIKKEECPPSAFKRLTRILPSRKRYSSMPAVKIGRLGVQKGMRRSGVGSRIMDYLKIWFTEGNKTGCRFLVVDAYNNPEAINFYRKNGFNFLTTKDEKEETRVMYFDLIQFTKAATPVEPSPGQ